MGVASGEATGDGSHRAASRIAQPRSDPKLPRRMPVRRLRARLARGPIRPRRGGPQTPPLWRSAARSQGIAAALSAQALRPEPRPTHSLDRSVSARKDRAPDALSAAAFPRQAHPRRYRLAGQRRSRSSTAVRAGHLSHPRARVQGLPARGVRAPRRVVGVASVQLAARRALSPLSPANRQDSADADRHRRTPQAAAS